MLKIVAQRQFNYEGELYIYVCILYVVIDELLFIIV